MSGVEVWQSLPTFKIGPKKTFFGMDKNSAHTFKLPKEMDNAIIELLNLGEGNLQSEIKLIIEGREYPATARLWRGNRDRPRTLEQNDLPEREGIMFVWARYEITIMAIRIAFQDTFEKIRNGDTNLNQSATFVHIKNNEFILFS